MLIFEGRNKITSGYKLPERPDHRGIDVVGLDSTVIRSPVAGVVKSSTIVTNKNDLTWEWGNYVRVDDTSGNRLFFCHMASRAVQVGQKVAPGDKLGIMGNTGYSFGAHTHFEVRKSDGKTVIDPAAYLGIKNAVGIYEEGSTTNGWVQASNSWYWYVDGAPVASRWVQEGGWWYYVGANKKMQTGYVNINGEVFFLNPSRITIGTITIPTGACIITDSSGNIKHN